MLGVRGVAPSKQMTQLVARVSAFLSHQALIPDGARVLVAVSGGGDSVALWCLLSELSQRRAFDVVGMAHLNHQLRGVASDADARFCQDLANRFGLPCLIEVTDIAALAQAEGISIETAGHQARHEFFDRAAQSLGATHIALGHTIDDQAETYLLRLLRGAGAAGLSAMRPVLARVVRPLLQVRRVELREYLAAQGVSFREDASNLDERVSRNRVRHDLLPHLRRYAPRVVETLAREAEIARADDEWLDQVANESRATLVKSDEGAIEVDAEGLTSLHPALARRVVRGLLADVSDRGCGFDQVERLRGMAAGLLPSLDLPGCRAELRGNVIHLTARAGRGTASSACEPFEYQLDVPGEVAVPEAGVTMSAECHDAQRPGRLLLGTIDDGDAGEWAVGVDVEARRLCVRNWREGDRFRPLGLNGHRKKLQDLFVDRKIGRADRHRVPVVLDHRDRVIWVVGLGLSDDFRITGATTSMVILKVGPLGDKL